MLVLTESRNIAAERPGAAFKRVATIWSVSVAILREAFALRRSLMQQYGVSEW